MIGREARGALEERATTIRSNWSGRDERDERGELEERARPATRAGGAQRNSGPGRAGETSLRTSRRAKSEGSSKRAGEERSDPEAEGQRRATTQGGIKRAREP